jgi:hypothetical protein
VVDPLKETGEGIRRHRIPRYVPRPHLHEPLGVQVDPSQRFGNPFDFSDLGPDQRFGSSSLVRRVSRTRSWYQLDRSAP